MPEQCLRFGEWGIVDGAIRVNLLRDLLFLGIPHDTFDGILDIT
jgi:hypothetical protein